MTAITNDKCTVRKFSRLHFRRKQYSVPLSAVYPITGSSFVPDVSYSSSSSDSEDEFTTPSPIDVPDLEDTEVDVDADVDDAGSEDVGASVDVAVDVARGASREQRARREPDRLRNLVVGERYQQSMGCI